ATGETYPKSDLFNKAGAVMDIFSSPDQQADPLLWIKTVEKPCANFIYVTVHCKTPAPDGALPRKTGCLSM
ncbi:hypothetical protein QVL76_07340, partial [Klebsiella pneumoniae]|nr:hypothetical protein [Klebsiella pneumoniae]